MTHTVLHINASARSEGSMSRIKSAELVAAQNATTVVTRDLAEGLPFLDSTWVQSTFMAPQERDAAQAKALKLSDTLVAEIQNADTIVIGTAMYNFSIPAVLKAWIDQIGRAGVTFAYTENGPKGLLTGKKPSSPSPLAGQFWARTMTLPAITCGLLWGLSGSRM